MAAKCDICGKMAKKYFITSYGDIVCSKTCKNAYHLESYLLRLEERREKDEPNNKKAYEQARDMAAWLSLYRYGNTECKKVAAVAINAWGS
jgi:ATP-dependent protease Clp ATPase subunit